MTARMEELAAEIVRLQGELDREIEARRKVLGPQFKDKVGEFSDGVTASHRKLRGSEFNFIGRTPLSVIVTAPVIFSLIIPMLIVDAWISLFQAICFRAYKLPRVKRRDYIAFDRRKLTYLNLVETLNCEFCAYANGVVGYTREIASRTEQYWCPIKHAVKITDPHKRYYDFLEYGDAEGYRARLTEFRERLRKDTA